MPPQNTNKINLRRTSFICSNQDFDSRRSWKYRVFHEDQKARRGGWTNKISAVNIWDASSAGSELTVLVLNGNGKRTLWFLAAVKMQILILSDKSRSKGEGEGRVKDGENLWRWRLSAKQGEVVHCGHPSCEGKSAINSLYLIYALLSRIRHCRDFALFGGHFWPKFDGRGHTNIL